MTIQITEKQAQQAIDFIEQIEYLNNAEAEGFECALLIDDTEEIELTFED